MTTANFGKYVVNTPDESQVSSYLVSHQRFYLFREVVDDLARIDVWKLIHILPKREIRNYDFDTILATEVARAVKHPEPFALADYPIKHYVNRGEEPYDIGAIKLWFNKEVVSLYVRAEGYLVNIHLGITGSGVQNAKPINIPLNSIIKNKHRRR